MSQNAQNLKDTRDAVNPEPDVSLYRVLRDDGTADYGARVADAADPRVLLSAYREMRRLRALDARMIVLQRQGRVGFYGACTGQEAVPLATAFALEKDDWVFPALREQSVMLVRGFSLVSFIAQVFGNSGDVLKGRQMPSHHAARSVNQVSWSSNIGTQIPQAVGAAWAMKLQKKPHVAIGFMGDGATSEADFHAAMIFAGRYRVPAVLVCQNNHWSISVPTERQTASRTIAIKGRAYGIPSVRVDGNDFLALYTVLKEAIRRARAGEGPAFIEAVTYRIGAHSSSDDPTRYRSDAEVEAWKKKDPLDRLHRHLTLTGAVDAAYNEGLDRELSHEIGEAVRQVEAMAPPGRESLFEDVYAAAPWHLVEQRGGSIIWSDKQSL